jgi:cyclopropane-fatty-acyl-phospholipid synthase
MLAMKRALDWVEQGRIPDMVVRQGIRALLRSRLAQLEAGGPEAQAARTADFLGAMGQAPVALVPALANEQHYEVPEDFFGAVLGPHRKYSSCLYAGPATQLAEAEAAALAATCERAGLADGQQVLEMGCGWGSLSLWMAGHYPASRITAVSNSNSQRSYIEQQAAARGYQNLQVVTCDMNEFRAPGRYDRIVSVEMFEHMRNWRELFARVAGWLAPGGRFFMHVFVHRAVPYAFEDQGDDDWMSRHFFSGGMMPSDELPALLQDDLRLEARWRWDGTHYERTANHWLANMDARRDVVWPILERTYGAGEAQRWWSRWRMFFMACAELWGYDEGRQWWVSHYRFARRADGVATT